MRRPAGPNGFFDGPLDGANAYPPRPDDGIKNGNTPILARGVTPYVPFRRSDLKCLLLAHARFITSPLRLLKCCIPPTTRIDPTGTPSARRRLGPRAPDNPPDWPEPPLLAVSNLPVRGTQPRLRAEPRANHTASDEGEADVLRTQPCPKPRAEGSPSWRPIAVNHNRARTRPRSIAPRQWRVF